MSSLDRPGALWPFDIEVREPSARYPQEEQEPLSQGTQLALHVGHPPPYLYVIHQDLDQHIRVLLAVAGPYEGRLPAGPAWLVWPDTGYVRVVAADRPLSPADLLALTDGREPDAPRAKGGQT